MQTSVFVVNSNSHTHTYLYTHTYIDLYVYTYIHAYPSIPQIDFFIDRAFTVPLMPSCHDNGAKLINRDWTNDKNFGNILQCLKDFALKSSDSLKDKTV